jgi:hypothetical protein
MMKKYRIRTAAIPAPDMSAAGRPPIYPFHDLAVGQYFTAFRSKYGSMGKLCNHHGKRLGRKFSIRSLGPTTIGIWRTA